MPLPDDGPQPMPEDLARQVPIVEQFIVGFTDAAFDGSTGAALERINTALTTLLHEMPATLVRKHIAYSHNRVYFAQAVIRLDGPGQILADLRKEIKDGKTENKRGYEHFDWADQNAPVALAQFDDPLFPRQWALRRLGVRGRWQAAPAGQRITVAIIDSGLRRFDATLHGDLNPARVEAVADCQPGGFFPDNVDFDGHGTFLAGTIEAWANNATGIASAVPDDWNITLMPVKFFGPEVLPDAASAAFAITHAAGHFRDPGTGVNPVRVINASWHVAPGDGGVVALGNALQLALNFGCLVVFAAGNDGTNNEIYPLWPANFGAQAPFQNNVLTVLATDRLDGKASFSNFGPNFVDIGAPGIHVLTTGLHLVPAPRYAEYSGTSASAAHVSAGAALVAARNPAWGPGQIVQHVLASADLIPQLAAACVDGRRLNLANAVLGPIRMVAPPPPPPPPPAGAFVAALPAAANFNVTWTVVYDNPAFIQVCIDFVTEAGVVFPIDVVAIGAPGGNRVYPWTPNANPLPPLPVIGTIRITPVGGNFPVHSAAIQIVP